MENYQIFSKEFKQELEQLLKGLHDGELLEISQGTLELAEQVLAENPGIFKASHISRLERDC